MSTIFQLTSEDKMMEILAFMVRKFRYWMKSLRYIHVNKISLEKKDVLYMFLFFFKEKGTIIHFSSDDVSGEIVKILQYIGVKFTFPTHVTNKNGDVVTRRILQEKVTIPDSEIEDPSLKKGFFRDSVSDIIDSWHKFSIRKRREYELYLIRPRDAQYVDMNRDELRFRVYKFWDFCSAESAQVCLKTIIKYLIHTIIKKGYESFPKTFDVKDDLELGIDSEFHLIKRNLHLSSFKEDILPWLFKEDLNKMMSIFILMNANWKAFESMDLLLELMNFNVSLIHDDAVKTAVEASVNKFCSLYKVQR
jgi:hypothetical protein